MNEQEFIKNFTSVENWINSMRPHWIRMAGDVHNDKKFWNECIHSVPPTVWTAWCEIYNDLVDSQPDSFKRHSHVYEDTVTIARRIDAGEAVSKPYNKTGYNKPAFRGAMAIKDIIADITGKPFATTETQPTPVKTKPSKAEVMEQWAKTQAMIESLFE